MFPDATAMLMVYGIKMFAFCRFVSLLGTTLLLGAGCATSSENAVGPVHVAGTGAATGQVLPEADGGRLPDGRSAPHLSRVTYQSDVSGSERQYFVYLPAGYANDTEKQWPMMVFLHGNGERGDGRAELDRLLIHGPLHETVQKRRDLPFVIVAMQMPSHETYIERGFDPDIELKSPGYERALDRTVVDLPYTYSGGTLPRGWPHLEKEVLAMVDRTVADHRVDNKRVYLTGLSYGGYGTWFFAKQHPTRFAAFAPICGAGGESGFERLVSAGTPLWAFHGGRDSVIPVEWQLKSLQALQAAGHDKARFTVHETLTHYSWGRVYGGWDLYAWFLEHAKP